jgi:hypothetical protein
MTAEALASQIELRVQRSYPCLTAICKPSAQVTFGLPDPLSVQARSHAMVVADRGQKLDRGSVRVRLPSSLTHHLGNAMRTSQKTKCKKTRANQTLAYMSSTLSLAKLNLVSMVSITAVSGAVLLALLVARWF